MKFACPKCNTRYNIPDEKLPEAQTLRFTCKSCKHVIRVRRKGDEIAAPTPASAAMPAERTANQAFNDSTRVASIDEIRRMQDDSGQAAAAKAPSTRPEWYVLVNGKQRGPVSEQDIIAMLGRHEIDARTYAWRDGMSDWLRLGSLAIFREHALQAGDAAWRVVKPVAPHLPQPPHAAAAATTESSPFDDATVAMPSAPPNPDLETARSATASYPPPKAAPALSAAAQTTASKTTPDPMAAMAVLSGMPTGEKLGRNDVDQAPADSSELNTQGFFADMATDEPPQSAWQEPELTLPSPNHSHEMWSNEQSMPESASGNNEYTNAPPGEATRVFMATAGLYRRQRNQKLMAAAIAMGLLAIIVPIALDVAGIWTIPGMGMVYDITGMQDPSAERATERVESKLAKSDLDPEERRKLRERLLGLTQPEARPQKSKRTVQPPQGETEGIADTKSLSQNERDLAASIFADSRKQETSLALTSPDQIRTPNLPKGLTQEAIFQVISENNRAMKLCVTEAMRKNEKLQGKMEVEMTIGANGRVTDVTISTARFKNSTMGTCTTKRIKNWRFPAFNGEAVTVIFPYVLSAGF